MMKKILAFAMVFCLLAPMGMIAQAGPLEDAKAQQKKLQNEKKALEQEKKKVSQNLLNNKQVRDSIIAELEAKGYEKEKIEEKIKEIEDAIRTLDQAIQERQEEYDRQLRLFQQRLVVLYVHSRIGADASELAQSEDMDELFRRLHTMQLISKADQDLMDSIMRKKQELDELKALREQEEQNARDQLEQSLKELQELEVSRSKAEERIQADEETLKKIARQEDQLEKEDKELGELIRKLSSSGKYIGGTMQWPLPGYTHISSYFGNRLHPILKVYRFHSGIDISAPQGTYIHAAASGKVIWSGWRSGGGGNTVIIDHGGGIATLYLHIMNGGLLVKEGQVVAAGDVIAKVGSTGLSTGPHLHFTVKVNGESVDPLKYVSPK
ncbi:MAG TPA: M23 family metallopeptidase [Thermoclostridium caenicola]|uniref:murein hydrolase activator EnvC family protein n=1 Tax=Thermoclostridium caenicola TaxID=659425 RepID=UPI002B7B67AA|nr:M23 family metallopeptidase [Thermoclostridium caenicola]HOK42835.1 M23 family metallopeptidase [Thermoclostridium caenicola]HOL84902.1 M23 family metallopeptidase [Thermoclostridium caenicola]HOP71745.1 M23 family metallopeptidase [Thermoclostridium caenicola]HPO77356.1 M23 family metallopeptidase [Thermoclostridium caenicola]